MVKKAKISLAWTFILLLTVVSLSAASDFGPRGRHGRLRQNDGTVSVAEPAAIALLGAGLVSLGIYAKKKRAKKQ